MKKLIPFFLFAFISTSCGGWTIQPLPYNPPTPFIIPTQTPAVFSPTPVVIGAAPTSTLPPNTITPTFLPDTPTTVPTSTSTPVSVVNGPALRIIVLGCNTSIDILHGMGEVTNAYITIKNVGNVELTNLVATLYALDEGRAHPDKTQEITLLPIGYEVTLKLTVDSTFQADTPIQVEITSNQGVFPREGSSSCEDIGVLAPSPDGLSTPIPSNP